LPGQSGWQQRNDDVERTAQLHHHLHHHQLQQQQQLLDYKHKARNLQIICPAMASIDITVICGCLSALHRVIPTLTLLS